MTFFATARRGQARYCMRFKRSPSQTLGPKLFHRRDVNARLDIDRATDRGAFLAKLWAHFGPPSRREGGFEYHLRDQDTNLDFTAYSNAKGPSYRGDVEQRETLRRVFEALEEILDNTPPVDCAIEYAADAEYGGGKWVLGCRDGRSFDLPDRRTRKDPQRAERRSHRAR